MPATTVDAPTVNNKSFARKLSHVANSQSAAPARPQGVYYFDSGEVTAVAAQAGDAGDQLFAFTFPANCRLLALQYKTTDRDTNGAPALVEDIIAETSGGTETVLINDTTVGQGGTSDELDLGLNLFGVDVSGMKLGLRVVTGAATAAAGTVRFKGLIVIGAAEYGFVSFA